MKVNTAGQRSRLCVHGEVRGHSQAWGPDLLGVVEQVESQVVGGGQDVGQQVDSSLQVASLDQTLQQNHPLCAELLQTAGTETEPHEEHVTLDL